MNVAVFSEVAARNTSGDRIEIDLAELRGMTDRLGEAVLVWDRPSVAAFHQALADVPALAQKLGGWPHEVAQDLLTMASAHVGPIPLLNDQGKQVPIIDLYVGFAQNNDALFYALQSRFVRAYPHLCRRELLIGYASGDAEFAQRLLDGEISGLKVNSKKNLSGSASAGSSAGQGESTTTRKSSLRSKISKPSTKPRKSQGSESSS